MYPGRCVVATASLASLHIHDDDGDDDDDDVHTCVQTPVSL